METLLHEMCHVFIMIIPAVSMEHHGASWQRLSIAVEKAMTRLMGRKVNLGRRYSARDDVKKDNCPHFSFEEVEEFFTKTSGKNKDGVQCQC